MACVHRPTSNATDLRPRAPLAYLASVRSKPASRAVTHDLPRSFVQNVHCRQPSLRVLNPYLVLSSSHLFASPCSCALITRESIPLCLCARSQSSWSLIASSPFPMDGGGASPEAEYAGEVGLRERLASRTAKLANTTAKWASRRARLASRTARLANTTAKWASRRARWASRTA
eukprot:6181822-Prymnesium_polylepis.1